MPFEDYEDAVEEDDEIQEYVPVKSEPVAAQQQEMYDDPSQGAAAGGVDQIYIENTMIFLLKKWEDWFKS